MAVLSIMRIKGDPDELLKIKNEKIDPVTSERAPEHGAISHTVVKTPDGLLMVNMWESAEGSSAMRNDPAVDQALRDSGLPQPEVEIYEVVQHETPDR